MLAVVSPTQAGVLVAGTRFVYGEGQSAINISVENTDKSAYLIKTQLAPWSETNDGAVGPSNSLEVPFIATPPLFALAGGRQNKIRVFHTGNTLRADRESLFQLSILAIPSGQASSDTVQIAIRSRFKFFYRPKGLSGDPAQAYSQLRWQRTGNAITATNPTPYYVTLFKVEANRKGVDDAGMVAPFSQRNFGWCAGNRSCKVQWQSINDYGAVMPSLSLEVDNTEHTSGNVSVKAPG
jgi:P pilus assembly chaperone PapD